MRSRQVITHLYGWAKSTQFNPITVRPLPQSLFGSLQQQTNKPVWLQKTLFFLEKRSFFKSCLCCNCIMLFFCATAGGVVRYRRKCTLKPTRVQLGLLFVVPPFVQYKASSSSLITPHSERGICVATLVAQTLSWNTARKY